MFSGRFPPLAVTRFGRALAAHRAAGTPLLDLTETNPTRVGLEMTPDLLAPLADPAGLAYQPDPQGLRTAREAVAIDLLRHGVDVDPAHLVLTSSTSEAYAYLFKLLCDAGDEVLAPAPSYPLFDHLARLEAIEASAYPLDPHGAWGIDVDAIARRITPRTRALLIVNPNNPTGSLLTRDELDALAALCRQAGLALIGDEVFADYRFAPPGDAAAPTFVSVLHQRACLSISLGGLSKSIGAPQLKLAWMAVDGPSDLVAGAIERLALIADTYLSVSMPVQHALPSLLDAGRHVRHLIRERIGANLLALRRAVASAPAVTFLEPRGGWSVVLRVPGQVSEESRVLELLEDHHVLVAPGYFYDFPHEAHLVVSLLVAPDVFAAGLSRTVEAVQRD